MVLDFLFPVITILYFGFQGSVIPRTPAVKNLFKSSRVCSMNCPPRSSRALKFIFSNGIIYSPKSRCIGTKEKIKRAVLCGSPQTPPFALFHKSEKHLCLSRFSVPIRAPVYIVIYYTRANNIVNRQSHPTQDSPRGRTDQSYASIWDRCTYPGSMQRRLITRCRMMPLLGIPQR